MINVAREIAQPVIVARGGPTSATSSLVANAGLQSLAGTPGIAASVLSGALARAG